MVHSMGSMLMLLLLVGCSSSSNDEQQLPQAKIFNLSIAAPDGIVVTRGDIGNVSSTFEESAINTLDAWVFDNHDYTLISYIHLNNFSFDEDGQRTISMKLADDFNSYSGLKVDIYVAANATASNCGLNFSRATTAAQLNAAGIGTSYFGATSPVTSVPYDGLPMSGLLRGQGVNGTSPIFEITTGRVKLVRAVSKMRFIFCKSISNPPAVSNLSISLKANTLPNEEYLFLGDVFPTATSHVKTESGYNAAAIPLVSGINATNINSYSDPVSYVYNDETGPDYETKINGGISAGNLSEVGRFYLRESDKKVEGTIAYTLGTDEQAVEKSVDFSMAAVGDFTRNHTWIVYGYFLGSGNLMLNMVNVRSWKEESETDKIYNW